MLFLCSETGRGRSPSREGLRQNDQNLTVGRRGFPVIKESADLTECHRANVFRRNAQRRRNSSDEIVPIYSVAA